MKKTLIRLTDSDLSRIVESVLLEMGTYDGFFDDLDNITDQWGNTPDDYDGDDEIDWDYVKGATRNLMYIFEGILRYGQDGIEPWNVVNSEASTLIEELNQIKQSFEQMGIVNQTFEKKVLPAAQEVYRFVQDDYTSTEINEPALQKELQLLDIIDDFIQQY